MSSKCGFGSIRKLPSGRYQAGYTGTGGAAVNAPHTFPTKVAAEMWLTDRRRGLDAEKVEANPITFGEYAPTWLATRQSAGKPIKDRTRDHYQGILNRELIPAFEDRPLSSITPADVRAWYAGALADKPTMRAHTYSLLRTILTTAVACTGRPRCSTNRTTGKRLLDSRCTLPFWPARCRRCGIR
jgi:hypothetical protein